MDRSPTGARTWVGWDDRPRFDFDALGNAYLIVEPLKFGDDLITIGMYVYKSSDGGRTWDKPVHLHTDTADDKQWIDADTSITSPHYGAVYAVWGANTPLRFSRSFDQGNTWLGIGTLPSGSDVSNDQCYAPSLAIGEDGIIHVSWHVQRTSEIKYTRSTDGGNTFSPVISVVNGVRSLWNFLPINRISAFY